MVHQIVNAATLSVDLEMSRQNADVDKFDDDGPKCWNYFVKHWPVASQPLGLFVICIAIWAICRILLFEYTTLDAVPMRMAILFIGAQICGILLRLFKLPEMLGMLGFGVFFTNMEYANFEGYNELESILRDLALVNIMLLAGLEIDLNALSKHFSIVMRLTILPTVSEVIVISIIARLAFGLPWMWGILLGLVVTAVSPNVVVDIMIWLKVEKLGMYKGIHTIIIAVTTCTDVFSIFFFGVVLGMIFSTGPLTEKLLQGPIGIAIGIVFGFVYGLLVSTILPSQKSKYSNGIRFVLMVLGGMLSVLGSKAINFPSAGALGCIIIACICRIFWKKAKHTESNDIYDKLSLLWKFVKPISFALIGKEVDFSKLDAKIVGFGIVIILAGSIFRLLIAYASAYGAELSWKERLYVTISGFPKATVQAALGPVALDLVRKSKSDTNYDFANVILIISVLAIMLTAPLGAVIMVKLAPKCLRKSQMPPLSL